MTQKKKTEEKKTEKSVLDPEVFFRPHITEKSALLSEKGIYTFEITPKANKKDVAMSIKKAYKVTPVKICTTKATVKQTKRRGIKGVRRSNRKALVYLKKGDKIEFV